MTKNLAFFTAHQKSWGHYIVCLSFLRLGGGRVKGEAFVFRERFASGKKEENLKEKFHWCCRFLIEGFGGGFFMRSFCPHFFFPFLFFFLLFLYCFPPLCFPYLGDFNTLHSSTGKERKKKASS